VVQENCLQFLALCFKILRAHLFRFCTVRGIEVVLDIETVVMIFFVRVFISDLCPVFG
jgi:hypothetical protein